MALDTRGLASGFAQGFGLADNYYTRQDQGERADRRMDMQEETFDMQKEQAQRQQNKETATFVFGKIANNMELADEEMKWLQDNPNYLAALNPEVDQALETAQRVIDPEDSLSINDEEGLYAMNTMFEPMINRGKGGKKRIVAGLPGSRPETMAFELEVEGEDGKPYRAPMTQNRGVEGEDDEVRQVPVEDLVNTAQGYRVLRNVINTNGASENAARMYGLLTGKTPERDKGVNVNDRLVNPYTGEVMADLRDPNGGEADWRMSGGNLYNQRTGQVIEGAAGADDLSPQQEVYAERLQGEIDHLWRMERDLQTGKSDGMSIFLGGMEETVTPDNKDALLSDIRTRIQSNEQELNKMLGVSAPQQGYDALIQEAEKVPPEQREQELADLKANPQVPYMVVRQIEEMWGMGGNAQQPGQQPQQQPVGQDRPGLQQPQQEPRTQPGLQPSANERPGAEPRPDQAPQDQGPVGLSLGGQSEAQSLQDQIVQRSRQEGQENYRASARQARQEVRSALDSNQFNQMDKNQRQAFLSRYGRYFKAMPEPEVSRLKEVFGERAINQYLQ